MWCKRRNIHSSNKVFKRSIVEDTWKSLLNCVQLRPRISAAKWSLGNSFLTGSLIELKSLESFSMYIVHVLPHIPSQRNTHFLQFKQEQTLFNDLWQIKKGGEKLSPPTRTTVTTTTTMGVSRSGVIHRRKKDRKWQNYCTKLHGKRRFKNAITIFLFHNSCLIFVYTICYSFSLSKHIVRLVIPHFYLQQSRQVLNLCKLLLGRLLLLGGNSLSRTRTMLASLPPIYSFEVGSLALIKHMSLLTQFLWGGIHSLLNQISFWGGTVGSITSRQDFSCLNPFLFIFWLTFLSMPQVFEQSLFLFLFLERSGAFHCF